MVGTNTCCRELLGTRACCCWGLIGHQGPAAGRAIRWFAEQAMSCADAACLQDASSSRWTNERDQTHFELGSIGDNGLQCCSNLKPDSARNDAVLSSPLGLLAAATVVHFQSSQQSEHFPWAPVACSILTGWFLLVYGHWHLSTTNCRCVTCHSRVSSFTPSAVRHTPHLHHHGSAEHKSSTHRHQAAGQLQYQIRLALQLP
jgi:hypothetical protein